MAKKFYITTAIDYTNDTIHVGHIYQKILADVFARYHRLIGDNVFFLTGTDEHGGKVEKAAKEAGLEGKEKEFVDKIARADEEEQKAVNVSFNRFIRTTDEDHVQFAINFWQKVADNNDIYLGEYDGLYCEGCEAFLNKSDLVDGKCPFHPNQDPKIIKEKNYFFRWSKYNQFLKEYITKHPEFVWPESARKEMLAFLDRGLKDNPISRSNIKFGIPVPGDPSQTIYVWFDALINYLSAAPQDFWPADIHLLGKDNIRWHVLLWPAMLKSAGYELPKTILVNGFLTLNGQKISKSLGNVIRTSELVIRFGSDAVRYYLIKAKPIDTDGDITLEKIKEVYNADLANGLGNLISRIGRLIEKVESQINPLTPSISPDIKNCLENYQLHEGLRIIWGRIDNENKRINENEPWKLQTNELTAFLLESVKVIRQIAFDLQPFMPETAEKILKQFSGPTIKTKAPLFPRLK